MFGFFGFILIFILIVVLIGFALLGNLIRFIFGLGKRTPQNFYKQAKDNYHKNEESSSTLSSSNIKSKKKIFDDNEGEYVEYEEIK